jgi:hypothetical protein
MQQLRALRDKSNNTLFYSFFSKLFKIPCKNTVIFSIKQVFYLKRKKKVTIGMKTKNKKDLPKA